jgi:hypothetical protein
MLWKHPERHRFDHGSFLKQVFQEIFQFSLVIGTMSQGVAFAQIVGKQFPPFVLPGGG